MTNVEKYADAKRRFYEDGTVIMEIEESFFSEDDFANLESLSEKLPYEHVKIGDAGEMNYLTVGRFMTDVERPMSVNRPLSDRALEIVMRDDVMEACKFLLDSSNLYVRRMQVNCMGEGCFVGYHLDTDSNPDYKVAVVIQLGHEFEGGEYVVHGGGRPPRHFRPTYRSVIVSNCEYPHEVTKVTKGERVSLVYFLSEHEGQNRRPEVEREREAATA